MFSDLSNALRVLVVEDNFLISFLIEDALRDGAHEVVGVATSAQEALAIAREARVDLALVDIDLDDGRTGVDLALDLQTQFGVPTVYATGQGDVARQHRSTALAVLDKPFTAHDVLRAVSAAQRLLAGKEAEAHPNFEVFGVPAPAAVPHSASRAGG